MLRRRSSLFPASFWRIALPVGLIAVAVAGIAVEKSNPPDLARFHDRSTVVKAADDQVLRVFMSGDDKWRLHTRAEDVDPLYLQLLKSYEDQRFDHHLGVDPFSVTRAVAQALRSGHVVSGASTLSMQAARLAMPRPRSLSGKLTEMARALQLEWHLGKSTVLDMYLTLAPFGGPVEGVRAASWKLFGKEPRHLSVAEAALLVAIPQSPGLRGLGGVEDEARHGRDQVLARALAAGILTARQVSAARKAPIDLQGRAMPAIAPHLTAELWRRSRGDTIRTHIDYGLQSALQERLTQAITVLPPGVSAAALIVRNRDAAVISMASGGDYFDRGRAGMMDLTRAMRSPGSTLKPFIYAMAFDQRIAHPQTLIDDRKTDFYGYQPGNFDGRFRGQVSISEALQQSLNIPAVKVLDRLGPQRFSARLQDAGLQLIQRGADGPARLPIALGGGGTSLRELVRAYSGLANDGVVPRALNFVRPGMEQGAGHRLLSPAAAAMTRQILAAAPAPAGRLLTSYASGQGIAYKTGTSYRFRDAWSVGVEKGHTIGVWVGVVGDGQCPGCSGRAAAAPILFDLFDLIQGTESPITSGQERVFDPMPPSHLRYFEQPGVLVAGRQSKPEIVFPENNGEIVLKPGGALPVAARRAERGSRWLLNGFPAVLTGAGGKLALGSAGIHRLTVVDPQGQSDTAVFQVHFAE